MIPIFSESERLIIRMLSEQDYASFVEGYNLVLPAQNSFDEGKLDTSFMTLSWYQQLLKKRQYEAEQDISYMLNIFCKKTGKSLGYCDITPHCREDFQYARIGYTIHNPYWGKGYGTESVSLLKTIGFDFLHLHRLEAHVDIQNFISKHILLKNGFTFECIRKAFVLENDVWVDKEIYYINNDHWSP